MANGSKLADSENGLSDLYLDLMKRCLRNSIYRDDGKQVGVRSAISERLMASDSFWARLTLRLFTHLWVRAIPQRPHDEAIRDEGRDWPSTAHTMVGAKRLDNIQFCVEEALRSDVPGDLIETGVWRGGSVILMRAILKAHDVTDRRVWVADSFEGLPKPNAKKFAADKGAGYHTHPELAVSLEQVKSNFDRYGLLDDQVRFLKGWFRDTLPTAPIEKLAVLRLDGDMYESTMDALTNLYPKLSPGGYVIVDDYGDIAACRQAVDDYRARQQITDQIEAVDWSGIYWRRS